MEKLINKISFWALVILSTTSLFLFFMLYGAWAGAFVAVHLWAWFVVPTFGLAPLSKSAAFGISLLIGLWTHQNSTGHKDEREASEKIIEYAAHIISPWFVLLLGYICHVWFM